MVITDPILRVCRAARSQRQSRARRSDGTPKVCRAARSLPTRSQAPLLERGRGLLPLSSGARPCRLRKRRLALTGKLGSWNLDRAALPATAAEWLQLPLHPAELAAEELIRPLTPMMSQGRGSLLC
jgi:hypothetical protein